MVAILYAIYAIGYMLYMLYNMIYNVVPQKTAPTAFKKDSAAPTLSGEAFREETTAHNNR